MKLRDLEATFIGEFAVVEGRSQWRELPSVEGAQGVVFVCPNCQNHSIILPFSNPRNAPIIPPNAFEKIKARWKFSGEAIDTLTLHPSIDLSNIDAENPMYPGRCLWHGFVKNGDAA